MFATDRLEHVPQPLPNAALGIEVALVLPALDAFVGDPVGFRLIPTNEALPDVVVAHVAVLVVGRVDVRHVGIRVY